MGFETLLGNERLRENLYRSIRRGHISHFYLISGPAGAGKKTLARLLSAAILCTGDTAPCGVCPACRKALGNTHPDIITVDDPERKTVPVELVRNARSDMYIQPNEGSHKIYLFPRGQDLGVPGQNALLKILEEPPAYGVFLLLTDNAEKLLPTVRSRCTELRLQALPAQLLRGELAKRFPEADGAQLDAAVTRSGGYLGQAIQLLEADAAVSPQTAQFAESLARKDALGLLQVLAPMEKWKRDQLIEQLEEWSALLHSALVSRSGLQALSPAAQELSLRREAPDLLRAMGHLRKAITYAQGNVSPAAICGWLEWALRG